MTTPNFSDPVDDSSDYEVGYRKPPMHSRFKKGQSGNRHGRPRKRESMEEVLNEELQEEVVANGRRMTKRRALIRSTLHDAIKGNPSARKLILNLMANQSEELEPFDPTTDDEIALLKLTQMYNQRQKEES